MTLSEDYQSDTKFKKPIAQWCVMTLSWHNIKDVKKFFIKGLRFTLDGPYDLGHQQFKKLKSFLGLEEDQPAELYYIMDPSGKHPVFRFIINQEGLPSNQSNTPENSNHTALILNTTEESHSKILDNAKESGVQEAVLAPGNIWLRLINSNRSEQTSICRILNATKNVKLELDFYNKIFGFQKLRKFDSSDLAPYLSQDQLNNAADFGITRILDSAEVYSIFLTLTDPEAIFPARSETSYPKFEMHSYETTDLGEVLSRAHAMQIPVLKSPRKVIDPVLGEIIALSLISPGGTLIEAYMRL